MIGRLFDNHLPIFVIVFIAITVGIIIISVIKSIKERKLDKDYKTIKPSDLVKDNKFVNENRERYEQKVKEYLDSKADDRKELHRIYIICGIIAIIAVFMNIFVYKSMFILIIIFIVLIVICFIKTEPYLVEKSIKTNEMIQSILKEYDSSLEYYPDRGYNRSEYMKLYYPDSCDSFSSNDLIVKDEIGFTYANVISERREEDDDGNTHYETEFDGTLAKIDIKNIDCTIILGALAENAFFFCREKDEFKMIKFENDEFNRKFLCYSNDELMAYKILTPSIMEEFINIKKNTIGNIDIRIINSKLYIRFSDTNGFDSMDEGLFESVAVLEEIIKTMKKVKDMIEDKI